MSILTILIILLVVAACGGFWSNSGGRTYGSYGWSPLGVIVIILVVLLVTGNLGHIRLR